MTNRFPDDENGKILAGMETRGDNLSIPRDVNFSLLFDDEDGAARFCEQVVLKGSRIKREYIDDEYGKSWDVTVTQCMVPTHQGITEMELKLEELAATFGGQSDGWGCFSQR
jgi:hypothetical protein